MIWLFKVNEVFWNDTPKINDYYTFETDDIDFDITKYDISLYFAISNYYILNDSNDEEIYSLRLIYGSGNPMRVLLSKDDEIYNIIRKFHSDKSKNVKEYEENYTSLRDLNEGDGFIDKSNSVGVYLKSLGDEYEVPHGRFPVFKIIKK
jgi:hypothetical protein